MVAVLQRIMVEAAAVLVPERQRLLHGDACEVEFATQRLTQAIGRDLFQAAWALQGQDTKPVTPPACPHCDHDRLRLVDAARPRKLVTMSGRDTEVTRPYYVCPQCHQGHAPADEAWHLGPGHLSPAMVQIAAEAGARLAFREASDLIFRHLGVRVDDNDVARITENMGLLIEARADLRAEAPTPDSPPIPAAMS